MGTGRAVQSIHRDQVQSDGWWLVKGVEAESSGRAARGPMDSWVEDSQDGGVRLMEVGGRSLGRRERTEQDKVVVSPGHGEI